MNEQVWYVYQQGQQLGPFGGDQITQMADTKMIAQDAYLFKVGWKDWRPIEECFTELGMEAPTVTTAPDSDRRDTAPRATVKGRVIVHNNGQLVIGGGVNISSTGIFVETKDQIFTVGEKLKLSVRIENFSRPFNVMAQVVRYNSDPNNPVGYGLRFDDLDEGIAKEIQKSVDAENVTHAQAAAK
jgi:Tfp pilus assembly protein PilZ